MRERDFPGDFSVVSVSFVYLRLASSEMGTNEAHRSAVNHKANGTGTFVSWNKKIHGLISTNFVTNKTSLKL